MGTVGTYFKPYTTMMKLASMILAAAMLANPVLGSCQGGDTKWCIAPRDVREYSGCLPVYLDVHKGNPANYIVFFDGQFLDSGHARAQEVLDRRYARVQEVRNICEPCLRAMKSGG